MRFASIGILTIFAASAQAAPSATDVVAKVQTFYKKADHLKGQFRQEVVSNLDGAKRVSHGSLELARPGKLRFDYAKSVGTGVAKSVRSDGTHLWIVNHDNLEIDTKDISHDTTPAAVAVLTGADPTKDFTATLTTKSGFGDDTSTVVELDPRKPSAAYAKIYLVVDPKDGHVIESAVIDSSGNVNHVYFDKLDAKASVAASDFIVDPDAKDLKKYKRVDLDAQQGAPNDGRPPVH
jgi:outer membrane lipoprotein-sorting protein